MEINVVNNKKENVGTINVNDEIFNTEVNSGTVWEVIKWQLAARRAGTAKAKTRSEIRGSRAKIWPQKGTGRARHGDRKANIFVGGGVAHGPHPTTGPHLQTLLLCIYVENKKCNRSSF